MMQRAAYRNPVVYDAECEKVFTPGWWFAGHVSQWRPGAARPVNTPTGSLVVTCPAPGELRAFHNSCRHVGQAMLHKPHQCKNGEMACPYHGWRFNLEGQLTHVPIPECFPGLNKEKLPLEPAGLVVAGGLVFVNQNPDAPTPEGLVQLGGILDQTNCRQMTVVNRYEATAHCNWKAPLEQGLECYHGVAVHPNTLGRFLDFNTTRHDAFGPFQLNRYDMRPPALVRLLGMASARQTVFHRFLAFPATMVSIPIPGKHVAVTSITPLGPERCRINYLCLHQPARGLPWRWLGARLSALASRFILWEDLRWLSGRQLGLSSGHAPMVGFGGHERGAKAFYEAVAYQINDGA